MFFFGAGECFLFILGIILLIYLLVITGALEAIVAGLISVLGLILEAIWSGIVSLLSMIWLPATIVATAIILFLAVKKAFFS